MKRTVPYLLYSFLVAFPFLANGESIRKILIKSSGSVNLSSVQAILNDVLKPDMSNNEKVSAILYFLRTHSYNHYYPTEFVNSRDQGMCGEDPVKFFNIYPWGPCTVYQDIQGHLYTAAGFTVRKKVITAMGAHAIVELFYDNAWHYVDGSMGLYFFKRDGKTIASMDDLLNDHMLLLNPVSREGFLADRTEKSLAEYLKQLTSGPIVENGIYITGRNFHEMGIDLSKGDEYILSTEKEGKDGFWFHPSDMKPALENLINKKLKARGFPLLPGNGPCPDPVKIKPPNKNYKFSGFSNSKLICKLLSKDGINQDRIVHKKNICLENSVASSVHPGKKTEDAEIIYKIAVPYIIVKGTLDLEVSSDKSADIGISISRDGKIFHELPEKIPFREGLNSYDISKLIYGKYEYFLKVSFPASENPTRLNALKLQTVMQSAPASVPGLKQGKNEIAFNCENPTALDKSKLFISFSWEEKTDGEKKTIQKTIEKEIKKDRRNFEMDCNGIPSVKNVKISVK